MELHKTSKSASELEAVYGILGFHWANVADMVLMNAREPGSCLTAGLVMIVSAPHNRTGIWL